VVTHGMQTALRRLHPVPLSGTIEPNAYTAPSPGTMNKEAV